MPLPMYQGLDAPQTISPGSMNLGLWFERFFSGFSDEFGKDEPARSAWLRQFHRKLSGTTAELQAKAEKIAQLATSQGGQTRIYHCPGSFVTGTGNPHPLENGFLWHPTLGTPYLPGSAVKGLVRALVETAYGGDDRDDVLKRWFGTVKKDDVAEQSGQFIFLDALPIAPCELFVDVMTPHMGKWYEKGGKTEKDGKPLPLAKDTQPGDWHSPVPVSYLTTRNLKLQFAILPRLGMEAAVVQQELANLWLALDKALEWLGAGAKTAIGFGVMEVEKFDSWSGARIKFNRANGSLSVEKSGQTAIALAPKGEELLASLPTAIQQKVKTNQFVKVTAYVAESVLVKVEA